MRGGRGGLVTLGWKEGVSGKSRGFEREGMWT
jgi:hypothetical protein